MRRASLLAFLLVLAAAVAAPAASAGSFRISEPSTSGATTTWTMKVRDDDPIFANGRPYVLRLVFTTLGDGRIRPVLYGSAWRAGRMRSLGFHRVASPEKATNVLPAGSTFRAISPIVLTSSGFSIQVRVKEPGSAAHTFGWIAVSKDLMGAAG